MTAARLIILALVAIVIALCGISLVRQSNTEGADGLGKALQGVACFIVAAMLGLTAVLARSFS